MHKIGFDEKKNELNEVDSNLDPRICNDEIRNRVIKFDDEMPSQLKMSVSAIIFGENSCNHFFFIRTSNFF